MMEADLQSSYMSDISLYPNETTLYADMIGPLSGKFKCRSSCFYLFELKPVCVFDKQVIKSYYHFADLTRFVPLLRLLLLHYEVPDKSQLQF